MLKTYYIKSYVQFSPAHMMNVLCLMMYARYIQSNNICLDLGKNPSIDFMKSKIVVDVLCFLFPSVRH